MLCRPRTKSCNDVAFGCSGAHLHRDHVRICSELDLMIAMHIALRAFLPYKCIDNRSLKVDGMLKKERILFEKRCERRDLEADKR